MITGSDSKAEDILARFGYLKELRQPWEQHWQEVSDYIVPRRGRFAGNTTTKGQKTGQTIYDGTAIKAAEDLASGLQGFLTSPSERWFELALDDNQIMAKSLSVRAWVQFVEDLIYHVFQSEQMKFYPSSHELYLDEVGFGTAVMNVEERVGDSLIRFKTLDLADCYIDENAYGIVDTLFRKLEYTPRQILQRFGENMSVETKAEIQKLYDEKKLRPLNIIHAVYPREKFDKSKVTTKNMPYASVYIWEEKKVVLSESGYNEFPYVVPRWYTKSREVYGRSPGMTALSDVKMLNEMSKTTLKAGQKAVDPALQIPDDGFMARINTTPGALNYYRAGLGSQDIIRPIEMGGSIPIGLEMENQRRQQIQLAFYSDLMADDKKAKMTIPEVMQRDESRMRLMSPQLGRLHSEYLGPLITRVYNILKRAGMVPPAPQEIAGQKLKLSYVSPLARAQRMMQAAQVQRMFEQFGNYAAIAPEMFDRIDTDGLAKWLTYLHGAPVQIIRTDDDVDGIRKKREEQQSQMQQLQAMEQGSKSLANVSKFMEIQQPGGML